MPVDDAERLRLISGIENARGSGTHVISLVLGDRQGMETRIARDILPLLYEHLRRIGQAEEIALYLYTVGGDTLAGWGIVNLIREYCERYVVIVPFRCLSTGTLMALGANEILMAPGAQLSPVDPSVSSPFNPPAPGSQQGGPASLLPVSVEDVVGYVDFIEQAGVKSEEAVASLLGVLADRVHPLSLGAVHRAREQVKTLAKKLLMNQIESEAHADAIVESLTNLPSHSYMIHRREAVAMIGEDSIEPLAWDLYKEYEAWMQLNAPYNSEAEVDANGTDAVTRTFYRGAIETLHGNELMSHVFRTVKELKRIEVTQPGMPVPVSGMQERKIAEGWTPWPEGGQGNGED